MQPSHRETITKYDALRQEARDIAKEALPPSLKSLKLSDVNSNALIAFRTWRDNQDRKVDWDWSFASRYCVVFPKAFDLAVWHGSTLQSLSLGRPTCKGTSIRLDFIERTPQKSAFAGKLFGISQLAYETYGRLIGACSIRLMEPMNKKLINYYTSQDAGFRYVTAKKGVPHFLEKEL